MVSTPSSNCTENFNHKLQWDINTQYDNVIVERKPDIVIAKNERCGNIWGQENN